METQIRSVLISSMAIRSKCHYVFQPPRAELPDSSFHVGTRQEPSGYALYPNRIAVYTAPSNPAEPASRIQTYTLYTDPCATYSYVSVPPRPHRPPTMDDNTGYCTYCGCQDPHCVERQLAERGLRDDLRHHEDQDKNGNMKDGDSVGGHSPG
jgi:hypothetical protein